MNTRAAHLLLFASLAAFVLTARAQDVISESREILHGTATPIGESSIRRDLPGVAAATGRGMIVTDSVEITQDTVVRVLAFQVPDFKTEDLYTHHYHVGMFSDSGNGSGTIFLDDYGYGEFEQRTPVGETPMTTFLYSIHADTGEVRVYIDTDPITVNRAAMVLTNLALNATTQSGARRLGANRSRAAFTPPPAVGDERTVILSGDNLTLEDLQDQIFEQSGCDVERLEGDFRYMLFSCR